MNLKSDLNRNAGRLSGLMILIAVLFLTGCQEPFEPTQENDHFFFSIYGYLDASADTQWVRVTPLRDAINDFPESNDATVTLESLETGESTVMNDSLFQYAENRTAWNFWTTMDLQPNQTYRLTAEGLDGNASSVDVKLPAEFPTPIFRSDVIGANQIEFLLNEQLVDVQTVYYIESLINDTETVVTFSHLGDTLLSSRGQYRIRFNPIENEEFLNHDFPNSTIAKRQVYVAITTNETPHFPSLDRFVYNLPEGVSNIRNGTGYLAGIFSKTIPYKSCFDDSGVNVIPCQEEPVPWQLRSTGQSNNSY